MQLLSLIIIIINNDERRGERLTADDAVFIGVITAIIVSVTKPRVTYTSVARRTLALISGTPRDCYTNQ